MEPLSVTADQSWLGNDGPWSVFAMGVGTPVQSVKAFVSTSMAYPLTVDPQGCNSSDSAACQSARGGFFNSNASQTWSGVGLGNGREWMLGDLDFDARGEDNITLGAPGVNVAQQGMATVSAKAVFLAMLTLRASTPVSPAPSLLLSLKHADEIPSLSWGYTAGSYRVYQANGFGYGSLTIGGYDAAQFEPSNVVFPMNKNNDGRLDLALDLLDIEADTSSISESLLPEPVVVSLDSSTPYLWLPPEVCQRFETAFNLTYDQTLDLYLVNDTVHEELLVQNATVSFTLGSNLTSSGSWTNLTIDLPYSSFDLTISEEYPGSNESRYYFPVRQTTNSTMYTLGRTFFQNTYVIADYERSTFSVNRALFPMDRTTNLQTIHPLSATSDTGNGSFIGGSRLSPAAIAGIVIGITVLMIATFIGGWLVRRRRHQAQLETLCPVDLKPELEEYPHNPNEKFELHTDLKPLPELENTGNHELAAGEVANEMKAELRPIYRHENTGSHELPGGEVASEMKADIPHRCELTG